MGTQKVADSRERMPVRPFLVDAELNRIVSELTRDVEQFDSLLQSHRNLFQQSQDVQRAERQWTQIRAELARITTRVHAALDEIALPIADS